MLQKNPTHFFSKPLTFYGSYQNLEEEIDHEEWNFADPWRTSLETDLLFSLQQKIGTFIYWTEST